eukprot:TRINITY_DN13602_c0_g3_i5.p1 TRINITY_DN13602_c0_g3~~TRINITY_DN13602_c0_g3_i5.p1  ORF type:complete len:219 (+),score=5.15 TRINITY_DN13602_c0_g3_i5:131-787(+)
MAFRFNLTEFQCCCLILILARFGIGFYGLFINGAIYEHILSICSRYYSHWLLLGTINILATIMARHYVKRQEQAPEISSYNNCFIFSYLFMKLNLCVGLYQSLAILVDISIKIVLIIRFVLYIFVSYSVLRYSHMQVRSWPKNVAKLYYEQFSYNHFFVCLLFLCVEVHYVIEYKEQPDVMLFSSFLSTLCTISEGAVIMYHKMLFRSLLPSSHPRMM